MSRCSVACSRECLGNLFSEPALTPRTSTADARLDVLVHHEGGRSTDPHYLAQKDFVVTTYNTLAQEARPYVRNNCMVVSPSI